jgi:hypothetical protein
MEQQQVIRVINLNMMESICFFLHALYIPVLIFFMFQRKNFHRIKGGNHEAENLV